MARKAKKVTKKENKEQTLEVTSKSKLGWLIATMVLSILIFFTVSKMGSFGIITNNIFTYLFGSLYIVPVLSFFFYGVFVLFFNEKINHAKPIAGIIIFDLAIMMLNSLIINNVNTFSQLASFIGDNFKSVFTKVALPRMGGVIGNFLYVVFSSLITRNGTLIVIILFLIIAAILIVPTATYKKMFSDMKTYASNKREERKIRKEEERLAEQKAEEERRARLAEKMAREAEEEEMRAKQQSLLSAMSEEKKEEVEEIEEEEEPVIPRRSHEHDYVLSKSPTFINLNDREIYGDSIKRKKNPSLDTIEPKVVHSDVTVNETPKVHKVKRNYSTYHLPKPYDEFLDKPVSNSSNVNKTSAAVKGERVIEILKNFNIDATLLNTYIGPSVTKFEIKPDSSVKINKIMNISDNIKMELAAKDIRIEAPIPGRSAVGIEIPNVEPIPVRMIDLIKNVPADKKKVELLFCVGKDLMGKPIFCDLSKMPHLLIAGATGSGKSVCINAIITSFLLRTNPENVKLVLVDPKKVEFTPYKDIPHLIWPIIDDAQMASNMLKKVVVIMEERYDAFATAGVRNIDGFNSFVDEYNANLKADEEPMKKLPYMVVIIDELADLMMVAGKDVELSIQRITQLARASGIHLIVATQRPSTDVITGLIKSNIPSRISFAVASSIDSRTILDQTGAERLLGNGDMLYYPQGETAPIRLQGVYVTDKEISKITKYVKSQAQPDYEDSYYEFLTNMSGTTVMSAGSVNADSQDSLYDEVVEFVKAQQKASTSLLQRRFGIGYNRAARLIDTLEDRGIIGPANGSKPREVYLKPDDEETE